MYPLPPDPAFSALEAENRALQEQNLALQEASREAGALARDAARYYQSQVRFRTVFEHSPLGHKIIGPDLLIRQANPAVVAMLGLASPEELLGRPIRDFAHPAHRDDWAELQAALWNHDLPFFALETCLRRADGSELWCRVTSVLFPDEGGEAEELSYTSLEDITQRRLLETRLEQQAQEVLATNEELTAFNEELHVANEELQEANAALMLTNGELDTFVYAASHDLRTPVTNMQGLVAALEEQLPAEARLAEQVVPLLGMMRTELGRFRQALDRLAHFGDVRQTPHGPRAKVVLSAVLEDVRQDLLPLLAASHGRLEVDLAGNPTVWFQAKHVHSVLLNLVGNALKFRHPDRDPVVTVRGYREARTVVVRVQDNGLGLTEEQQKHIFRLFRRLHPHIDGTGVGLYLVKKVLENAGGSVQVDSRAGQGSTFTVVFPA